MQESPGQNFLTELSSEATRGGTPLNPLLMNLQSLVGDVVVVGGSLGHSNHKII